MYDFIVHSNSPKKKQFQAFYLMLRLLLYPWCCSFFLKHSLDAPKNTKIKKIAYTCPDAYCIPTSLHRFVYPFEDAIAKGVPPSASDTKQDFEKMTFLWGMILLGCQ